MRRLKFFVGVEDGMMEGMSFEAEIEKNLQA